MAGPSDGDDAFDTSGGGGLGDFIPTTSGDGGGSVLSPEDLADSSDTSDGRAFMEDLEIDPRVGTYTPDGGPGARPSETPSGEEDVGVGDGDPPSYSGSDPPEYSSGDTENKYILNEEQVQIRDVLDSESFLYIDSGSTTESSTLVGNLSKFYFVYGLLVDIDVTADSPKYVFRLYENFADLELEIGTFLSTPPEEFSQSNGLFQDMSLFDDDIIIAGRFERRIDTDSTESYDQEYLMYDKITKKFDGAAPNMGRGLWLSKSSRDLFNYRFNLTELGAKAVLNSCIVSIRDNFKIPRSQDTEYDFKFCESQLPEISGEQVITTNTTDTTTGNSTTSGGSGGDGGY